MHKWQVIFESSEEGQDLKIVEVLAPSLFSAMNEAFKQVDVSDETWEVTSVERLDRR